MKTKFPTAKFAMTVKIYLRPYQTLITNINISLDFKI